MMSMARLLSKKYHGDVGFIYFEAPDTVTREVRIESALRQPDQSNFNGTVL